MFCILVFMIVCGLTLSIHDKLDISDSMKLIIQISIGSQFIFLYAIIWEFDNMPLYIMHHTIFAIYIILEECVYTLICWQCLMTLFIYYKIFFDRNTYCTHYYYIAITWIILTKLRNEIR